MKKLLASIFALALVFTMISVFASAEDAITIKTVSLVTDESEVKMAPQGDSDITALFDGDNKSGTNKFGTAGIILFQNMHCTDADHQTEFSLVVELNEASDVGGVKVDFYKEYSSMIGLPKNNEIKVEQSTDGTTYVPVDEFTFEGEAIDGTNEVQTVDIEFDNIVNTKFVKLTFAYGISDFPEKVRWEWIGLTEIDIVEKFETVTTSTTEPTTTTTAPTTTTQPTEPDDTTLTTETTETTDVAVDSDVTTPETGENGFVIPMAVAAALAIVLLAGSVVKRVQYNNR